MTKTRFIVLFGGFLIVNSFTVKAQNGIVTNGNDATGLDGTVNSTIGQINCKTIYASSGSVSEGIQQPYEIYIIAGIQEENITLNISFVGFG